MTGKEKVKLKIHIGPEWLNLTVDFDSQEEVRETESHIAALYDKWHREYPSKTPHELTAMLAYQYASYFLAMRRREAEAIDAARKMDERLAETMRKLES